MGHIKEPVGVDFFVDSSPLTSEDKKLIRMAIAYYKATGKKMKPKNPIRKANRNKVQQKALV